MAAASRPWLERHALLVLVAAGVLVCFFRLGATDLVRWDEVYYSSRAWVIVTRHAWLDQSAGSVGGVWIGAHPPLVIWAMAIACKLFGMNEWALRAPAALAGIGCLVAFRSLLLAIGGGTGRNTGSRRSGITSSRASAGRSRGTHRTWDCSTGRCRSSIGWARSSHWRCSA